jgi:hypothetical protein
MIATNLGETQSRTTFQKQHVLAGLRQHAGDNSARCTGADDDRVVIVH